MLIIILLLLRVINCTSCTLGTTSSSPVNAQFRRGSEDQETSKGEQRMSTAPSKSGNDCGPRRHHHPPL
ncbi:hypothetical protein NEUTE1DRAFT_42182 [Neurospora tetrasperma FGSC 2508]|uniref:Secreted protein n=1 Tax=Neurospora tetrasperma (strain FGSC 2508 / ATCC MYA-4615 / P0657) TaxID=510951 RepID=F8MLF8_NEUT8|nr:uncharacterized protein NEUTE1DRAFT_42182 [Neurospora tetrasperma FGSC 2508]EGO57580.1 hypothetical protein NEUTE1DRAFT_42182 [Neurospora tetrasperma FGSC 2508]EGZ72156.1 hypothetical protein NEUTE2DRAFT_65759 [Neurospora tetrasperma FGSC 2509]